MEDPSLVIGRLVCCSYQLNPRLVELFPGISKHFNGLSPHNISDIAFANELVSLIRRPSDEGEVRAVEHTKKVIFVHIPWTNADHPRVYFYSTGGWTMKSIQNPRFSPCQSPIPIPLLRHTSKFMRYQLWNHSGAKFRAHNISLSQLGLSAR